MTAISTLSGDDYRAALALYVIGDRDWSDFIELVQSREETSDGALSAFLTMTAQSTANSDNDLNRLLRKLVEDEQVRRAVEDTCLRQEQT
jgi:hypothetical protein